jgi:formylglycine-generating enzyme required for sulfatase activity
MCGNVWEWVADWWAEDYYQTSPVNNPQGPLTGDYRVLRGGSWDFDQGYAAAPVRLRGFPVDRNFNFGFRVCAVLPPP